MRIAILGAGISGLSVAWYLKNRYSSKVDIQIFEKQARPGGWIKTERIGSFLFEYGPRSLRATDCEEALELIDSLGLNADLVSADLIANQRYLYHHGRLESLPQTIREWLSSPLRKGVLKALWQELITSKGTLSDESVHSFISRRFSPEIADRFIDPLIKGIYAGDAKKLSMRSCFPAIWQLEQQHRSLLLGGFRAKKKAKRTGLLTFKQGLSTLTDALGKKLETELHLNCEVQQLSFSQNEVSVHLAHGIEKVDHLISTLPSYSLAPLLPKGELAELLQMIPFTSVGVVHLGYDHPVNPYRGFGYLVPSNQNQEVLGVIFDSAVFPQHNQNTHETRLTVMLGGESQPELLRLNETALIEIAKKNVSQHLGIKVPPTLSHAFIAKQAIPQYLVGHSSLLQKIQSANQSYRCLSLLGTSFSGVSVNHCIKQAKELALALKID